VVDFNRIAKKWQKKWEKRAIFKVNEHSNKKKYYILEMFPYPSAYGQHMGHVRNYSIGDCYARFKRMQGFNVLYPMGYDAFGLPAENAAIKEKLHPKIFTEKAIKNIMKQQKELGNSYDWNRLIATYKPNYYKWNQLLFLKFLEKGLVYRKEAPINYCNSCKTVLANEQVINEKCWRCNNNVEIKQLEQWFLKITEYADRLLEDIEKLDWPNSIKIMQKNWIGKSHGVLINFRLDDTWELLPVFTTRPDTIYGTTFIVISAEHPKINELIHGTEHEEKVKEFINKTILQDKFERTSEDKEKEGIFIGKYAINPITNEKLPIYIANFVLLEYGTGSIMAVPAHDQRDFEFAKKYDLPIKVVIKPENKELNPSKMKQAYIEDGILLNSNQFNNLDNKKAIEEITNYLEEKNLGKKTIQYKLKDWLISRQRYWGTPIPVVYCSKCGIVAVHEVSLPILLPEKVDFTGEGNPLKTSKIFLYTKCPRCGEDARRETDTMDTFFDSSWYFLRYCSPNFKTGIFSKEAVNYWMPVDQYIGGAEHAVLHLLYARFFIKVLKDLEMIKFDEPFLKLFNQGTVTKDGKRMSKSKGNIVNQEEISEKYGIDTARLFLLFIASPDKDLEYSDKGIKGSYKFLNKLHDLLKDRGKGKNKNLESKLHKLIKEVSEDIENFKLNNAIVKLMEFTNYLKKVECDKKPALKTLSLLLNPFVPHLSEEMWEKLKGRGFSSLQKWPEYDVKKINLELDYYEELTKNIIEDIREILKLVKIKKPKKINIFIAESWKFALFKKVKKELEKEKDVKKIIKKVMDKKYAKEISKIVPKLVKDASKIPNLILNQEKEFKAVNESKERIGKEFNLEVEVIKNNLKALPGKPAIKIE